MNIVACCLSSLFQAPERQTEARPDSARPPVLAWQLGLGTLLGLVVGCGTTRMTDTQRTATEQLLISNAIDQAVSQLDFRPLAGKSVYFDPQFLDGTVDRGYVVSSLRQHLLASGVILLEDRAKATYVVEARSGGIGTDRYSVLLGVPQMSVPSLVPGVPAQIPEIPVAKKNDEQGIAKIALFAYNRQSGQRLWQSGAVEAASNASDTWVLGLGPFRAGSIAQGTEFAGEELPNPLRADKAVKEAKPHSAPAAVTYAAVWPEKPAAKAGERFWPVEVGRAIIAAWSKTSKAYAAALAKAGKKPDANGRASTTKGSTPAPATASVESKPMPTAPCVANMGGHAETAPARIQMSGLRVLPDS
jgi:hypothetical protein